MSTNIIKLSEILKKKIVHISFERTTTLYFEDGSRLESEYSEGHFGSGTGWSDTEVKFYDPAPKQGGRTKFYDVEVDTECPSK